MTLIKSISGIRGTIGGLPSDNLTPLDIVKFTAAYSKWLINKSNSGYYTVIVGRDARVSGIMVRDLVSGTLQGMGINVIDIGLASTPTTEIAVTTLKADGGIILTASHNPAQWNALKLLNGRGEFLSAEDGNAILDFVEKQSFTFADYTKLGSYATTDSMDDKHIADIIGLSYVDVHAIRNSNYTIAIDCVNSVGGIIIPKLLDALGVKKIIKINCEPNGLFPHNPEPVPENLTEISEVVKKQKVDVGFVVDPDVDRLAIIKEDGSMFGEEYTLVSIADYVLGLKSGGNTVSNLSSTRALKDVTVKFGGKYTASAVGEVNVVTKMKETNAVIGGEGNGGVILPDLHYGRDALVGIALFLTFLAKSKLKCSVLRSKYPDYYISKNKIELKPEINVDQILKKLKDKYSSFDINEVDGVKISFAGEWVHLRKSNTEPIIRIIAESIDQNKAERLARQIISDIAALQ